MGCPQKKQNVKQGDKGWSKDGILRFNALFAQVDADRKAHPTFVRDWVENYHASKLAPGQRSRFSGTADFVVARNELGDAPEVAIADDAEETPSEGSGHE